MIGHPAFPVEPWCLRETALDLDVLAQSESVFALVCGWPLTEDVTDRPCGLSDFRVLDPSGYYLRITNRV